MLAPRRDVNFVAVNRSLKISPRKPERERDPGRRHADFGAVPEYLQARKEIQAEEEARRRARQPDPSCPPGMSLMPEAERLETLAILRESEKETQGLLFKLPLHSTTPSMLKRKDALESKLGEIEAAKKIFSKEKVYVQS